MREQFIELSSLAVYAIIAQERSLTVAAKKLGLTQSALSQILKHIEVSLGVELVDRSTRPLRITPAGVRFQAYANSMLIEARKISSLVSQSAKSALPKITLGLIDSFASTFGPHIIGQLQSRAEQLTITAGFNGPIRDALLERHVDLIVSTNAMDDEEGLERYELFRDPLVLVTPLGYSELSLDGLRGLSQQLPMVRYSKKSALGVQIDVHLRRLGLEPPYRFEIDSSDAMLHMVKAGPCWTLTTALCLYQARHALDGITIIPVPGGRASRSFHLVARKDEQGDMPEQVAQICRSVFDDILLDKLHQLLPWENRDVFKMSSHRSQL